MRMIATAVLCTFASAASAQNWLEVQPEDRPITVSASGIVTSSDVVRYGPPATRRWNLTITRLAREGSTVEKGDLLAEFDSSSTDDRVRQKNADLNAKQSELESLLEEQRREIEEEKVNLAEARSAADKAARKAETDAQLFAGLEYQKLVEQRNITADLYEREKQRRALNARVRDAKVAELEADIARLKAEVTGAERELQAFTISAPKGGLVIIGTNREGQKLSVNDQTNPGLTVVELANADALIVKAEVPEFAATSIEVGQDATLIIDAAGGTPIVGSVTEVGSIVRRQSQYSQAMVRDVTVSLPDDVIKTLRPGMSVKLTISVGSRRNALAIPDNALQYRDGKPGVRVRGDGWTPIVLGDASAGMRIVENGLAPGDEVGLP